MAEVKYNVYKLKKWKAVELLKENATWNEAEGEDMHQTMKLKGEFSSVIVECGEELDLSFKKDLTP